MAFEGTYPVSRATQQYQMEPVGTELSNTTSVKTAPCLFTPGTKQVYFDSESLKLIIWFIGVVFVTPPPRLEHIQRFLLLYTVRVYHIYHCRTVKMFKWINKKLTHMQTVEEHRDSGWSQSCFLLYTGTSHSR